jgi:flagellar hook-length control protein FliK
MSTLTPPTPVSAVHASQAAAQARARQPGAGTAGHGTAPGAASPFAQMLQGLEGDAPAEPNVAAQDPAPTDEGTAAPADEPAAEARQPRPEDQDDTATPPPTADALPPEQRAASLGQAGWLATARARAAAAEAAARGHAGVSGLAGLQDGRADACLQDGRADAGLDPSAGLRAEATNSLAGAAVDTGTLALDGAGWKPTLDAASVHLAPTPVAEAGAPAGAEFSLPSLGDAGAAPAAAAPAEPPPAQATLAPPPGSAAFPAALGAQLNTWLQDGVQHASLELNPQDMGPIEVHIALRDGRTLVELGADVAATRQALAEALPELAEALGDVGLELSGGSVSDQTGQQGRPDDAQGQRSFALPAWLAPAPEGAADTGPATPQRAARGLVDLVA